MGKEEREPWARLASLKHEVITPYDEQGVSELMAKVGTDPPSIFRLIDLCSDSDNPGFVSRCVGRLSAYQSETGGAACLLQGWVQLTPAIIRTWLRNTGSMSTALGAIEGEFRASYPLGPPEDVDCRPLGSLVWESLVPRDLPTLRVDVYLSAISLIGFLLEHSWLTRLFAAYEHKALAVKISAVLPWLHSQGYPAKGGGVVSAYEDEIAAAERIIERLSVRGE